MMMLEYHYGVGEEENWIVCEASFNSDTLGKCESIMALGNGYMGVRSSLEESYVKQTRGLFIAGTFNKFDTYETTELPNAADVIEMEIVLNNERFSLEKGIIHSYRRYLNLKTGELVRKVMWESPSGEKYEFCFRRFVSLHNLHLLGMKVEITPLTNKCTIELTSGINGQMTNSGVQHFHEGEKRIFNRHILELIQTTIESKIDFVFHAAHIWKVNGNRIDMKPRMAIGRRKIEMTYTYTVPQHTTITMEKLVTVHTSRDKEYDHPNYSLQILRQESLARFQSEYTKGYDSLFYDSCKKWKEYWEQVDMTIDSCNSFDQLAIRFAQYHLLIMTPVHDSRFGIGAKGLTGEGYKGHSFWDSEIFIVPYFLFTKPDIARGLLEYRYHTLDGARKKAKDNGYEGAMYPWESAFTGEEETPIWGAVNILTGEPTKIWSGLIEHHITADIAYAIWQYYQATNDDRFMEECGSEILFETATFWSSRVEWDDGKQAFVIKNVIGPDEYKEHVDNNAFTNYMAHWNIQTAISHYYEIKEKKPLLYERLNAKLNLDTRCQKWKKIAEKIYLPKPRKDDGVIPQDDTYLSKPIIDISKYRNASSVQTILQDYSREQVINFQVSKQADVVMLLYLLHDQFSDEIKRANWYYYESKTIHDSSLSMAVHSIVASDMNDREAAYRCFEKATRIDLGPNMKSSDAGIHAASLGGIWKAIVFGFGGIRLKNGVLQLNPRLPYEWKKIKFPIVWKGQRLEIELTHQWLIIENKTDRNKQLEIEIEGKMYSIQNRLHLNLVGVNKLDL
jgi:hypothetical glycosyl hydrolase